MLEVKVTELRADISKYLARVESGESLAITSRGRVVARLMPAEDVGEAATSELKSLRGKCRIGDVTSPMNEQWNADRDHP